MKLIYLAFARMPTEKAHGLTIAKSCEAFARAGVDVTLVIPRRASTVAGTVYTAYGVEQNFRVQEINVPDLVGRFGGGPLVFRVHYFLFYSAVKLKLLFAKRETVVYTRDTLPLFFSWLGYGTVFECHAIAARRALFFFTARRASRIVTISNALKDAFCRAGFSEADILVAPSGVEVSVFNSTITADEARKQLHLQESRHIAVYTGNFTTMGQDKGIADIIKALPDAPDVLFVGVGGSEADIERYTKEAQKAGVSARAVLLGRKSQSELAVYQRAADVLLMPFPDTPHYRNHMSPVKMFEYMASGRPIIASDLPTIREVLNDENAVIVPPGDHIALAGAMRELCTNPSRGTRLAGRALSDVAPYSWSERAKRIIAFIG